MSGKDHVSLCVGARTIPSRLLLQSGPIFLDQLHCDDEDTNLLECSRGIDAVGLVLCDHTEDVWIQCNGKCNYTCLTVLMQSV